MASNFEIIGEELDDFRPTEILQVGQTKDTSVTSWVMIL